MSFVVSLQFEHILHRSCLVTENHTTGVKLGGVGMHKAYILRYKPMSMIAWAQTLFATEVIYGVLMALEKTSILLLYKRLFYIERWFRVTTYILIITIWIWGISESMVAIFQCKPIAYQWNKKLHGTCVNQPAYHRWVRVPNIIHDVVMLALPVPMIWKLQLAFRQRLALMCLFIFGSL
jgi:hypothetical protein